MNPSFRLLVVPVLAVLFVACDRPAPPPVPAPTNAPAAAPKLANASERLLGRWLRPDGGYVLELRSRDTNGLFSAAYLNPNPIHVERAEPVTAGDVTKLTVVLRDTGYPGCIYTLTYDDKNDQLVGTYYQAAVRETYEVVFTRLKDTTP